MKRKALALTLISALLFSMVAGTQFANLASAQFLGSIAINADGTVDPADAPIQRVRDTYTLTGDVGSIGVQRSNIVLDGNGHTLPGIVTFIDSLGNNVTAKNAGGVYLKNVENTIVKNLTIKDCQIGIYLEQCSNVTVTGNTITGTHVPVPRLQYTGGIFVWAGSSNTITENQLANNYCGIYLGYNSQQNTVTRNNITNSVSRGVILWDASNNVIHHNSFIDNAMQVQVSDNKDGANSWDNGLVGNFWSDYNGTDSNRDGIGDTPYVIDGNNIDNYPLMFPYDIENDTVVLPPPEPFPTILIVAALVLVAVVGLGFLFYFKRSRTKNNHAD